MPTLREMQRAVSVSLVDCDDTQAVAHIVDDGIAPDARLNIYRNTFVGVLTTALCLSYPAVYRLVGAQFFEGMVRLFIQRHPPEYAYLDLYGAKLPNFIEDFAPAASLVYLPDVARLEWAVARALHAPDLKPLDIARLAEVSPASQDDICFVPHPSISLLQVKYPVDAIWRAVLAQDESALAQINLRIGDVCLLVERRNSDVEVTRIGEAAWEFLSALCASRPLADAIKVAGGLNPNAALAEHLACGRFVGFELYHSPCHASSPEVKS